MMALESLPVLLLELESYIPYDEPICDDGDNCNDDDGVNILHTAESTDFIRVRMISLDVKLQSDDLPTMGLKMCPFAVMLISSIALSPVDRGDMSVVIVSGATLSSEFGLQFMSNIFTDFVPVLQ